MSKKYVSNSVESSRMFRKNWMEAFSKVHFSVPLIIFLPVIGYFLFKAIQSPSLSILEGFGMFLLGFLTWTLTEYVMHRFVFHYEPDSKIGKRLHFIFHGVHHDYPRDRLRLVLPPSVSVPLAIGFYFLWRWIIPGDFLFPFYAAFILGYLIYDMLHYAIHHVNLKGRFWNVLKTHHLKHHYVDDHKGYGVSSPLWDMIIHSNFPKQNLAEKNKA